MAASGLAKLANFSVKLNNQLVALASSLGFFLSFTARFYLAYVFFKSGLTKISNWELTLFLFEYEYAVPLLPIALSAYLSTFFELVSPILLACGLFTRFAALSLFLMSAVIQFFVYQHLSHFFWLYLSGYLMVNGGGKLTIDYYLSKYTPLKL